MAMYRHQSTGAIAELLENKGMTVSLKAAGTDEIKEVGAATFKRWWKQIEDEAPAAQVEDTEIKDTAEELADVSEDEVPIDEENTATDDGNAPADEDLDTEENIDDDIDGTEDKVNTEVKPLTISKITAKLENLFDILNGLYFQNLLPKPIITVQSTPRAYGHCSSKKIWNSGVEGEGDSYYEINIGAEYLNRPSEQTAATMLHEMVHLYCRENNIKETCQGVRYHTKVFKEVAEACDLIIDYNRSVGYSLTEPSKMLIEKLKEAGYELEIPFARHTLGSSKTAQRNKYHTYSCSECGQTVRSTAELNIKCGICDVIMERVA